MNIAKVGQQIRVLDNAATASYYVDHQRGKVFTVKVVRGSMPDGETGYEVEENYYFFPAAGWEVVEEETMKEFKIGQTVRIVDNKTSRGYALTGPTYRRSFEGHEFVVEKIVPEPNDLGSLSTVYATYFVPPECCVLVKDVDQPIVHSDMVAALAKPGADIVASLTPEKAHLLHMAVGIAGEAGELLDAIKKAVVYNKPLDLENVVEELGDLEFYMEGLRQGVNVTREQTIDANIAKLGVRYAGGYSDAAAQARADKNDGVVIDVDMAEVEPSPDDVVFDDLAIERADTKADLRKLNVGDLVRTLNDDDPKWDFFRKGQEGVVERVDDYEAVIFFGGNAHNGYEYVHMEFGNEDGVYNVEVIS